MTCRKPCSVRCLYSSEYLFQRHFAAQAQAQLVIRQLNGAVCLQHDDMLLGGVHKLFFPVIEHGAVAAKTQEGTHAFQHLYGQRYACKTVIVIEMREAALVALRWASRARSVQR